MFAYFARLFRLSPPLSEKIRNLLTPPPRFEEKSEIGQPPSPLNEFYWFIGALVVSHIQDLFKKYIFFIIVSVTKPLIIEQFQWQKNMKFQRSQKKAKFKGV